MCSSMKFHIKCLYVFLVSRMLAASFAHLTFELFTITVLSNPYLLILKIPPVQSKGLHLFLFRTVILLAPFSSIRHTRPPLRIRSHLSYLNWITNKEAALWSLPLVLNEYYEQPKLLANMQNQFHFSSRNKLAHMLKFLICVQEVSRSNLGWATGYRGRLFCGFPQSFPENSKILLEISSRSILFICPLRH